jgi:hypothetical protein
MIRKLAFVGLVLGGCLPGQQTPASLVDTTTVLDSISNGAYRTDGTFKLMNPRPYASAVSGIANINVWVSGADYSDYAKIDPAVSGSGVSVKPGTTIVREVVDDTGTTDTLTVIVKGPSGYNPAVGDLWFAVTDPLGAPMTDSGYAMMGQLTQCFSCHEARAKDGYLFGVATAARNGTATSAVADAGMPVTDMSMSPADAAADAGTTMTLDAATAHDLATHDASHGDMGHHHHPICGDFYCEGNETCKSCPSDCTHANHDC